MLRFVWRSYPVHICPLRRTKFCTNRAMSLQVTMLLILIGSYPEMSAGQNETTITETTSTEATAWSTEPDHPALSNLETRGPISVRKCCGDDQHLKTGIRGSTCVQDESEADVNGERGDAYFLDVVYKKIFDQEEDREANAAKPMTFEISYGFPECNTESEPRTASTDLLFTDFVESKMFTKFANLSPEEYCVDMLTTDQMATRSKNKHDIIIKICTEVSDAEAITFRKCCPQGLVWSEVDLVCRPLSQNSTLKPIQETVAQLSKIDSNSILVVKESIFGSGRNSTIGAKSREVIRVGFPDCSDKASYYRDEYLTLTSGEFFIVTNGSLYLSKVKSKRTTDDYCVDRVLTSAVGGGDSHHEVRAFACDTAYSTPDYDAWALRNQYIMCVFCSTTCVFSLLLTAVVYAILPNLMNLHGKCVFSYILTLFFGYLFLMISHLGEGHLPTAACKFVGLTVQFTFLAASTWLSVMAFDIWRRLRSLRAFSFNQSRKTEEKKTFILYSLVAWCLPLSLTLSNLAFDLAPGLIKGSKFDPNLGNTKCWFNSEIPPIMFFYFPITVLFVINVTLFVLTAIKLMEADKESKVIGDTMQGSKFIGQKKTEKSKFWLYFKLFVVMGICWMSAKMVSWIFAGYSYIWYLSDFVNMFQGHAIMAIFIWKRKVWRQLKERLSGQTTPVTSSSNQEAPRAISHPYTTGNSLHPYQQGLPLPPPPYKNVGGIGVHSGNGESKEGGRISNGQRLELTTI